ncbi:MAG: hypothetical protein LH660_04920 [Phormidesmis sp. CAN_BIN36]|nr:hypothetical protein [Phormidesmis sp. CAN_BIN36]
MLSFHQNYTKPIRIALYIYLSPDLQHYVSRVDDATGILVARPVDPQSN